MDALDVRQLSADLARLQRNRGLQSPRLGDRVGESLARVVGYSDTRPSARESLIRQLLEAAQGLPHDLHAVFVYGCATRPDLPALLGDRMLAVSRLMDRSQYVVRERLTEANLLVAARLLEVAELDGGWFLDRFAVDVDLREEQPIYRSHRTLVVTSDSLSTIDEQVTIPDDGTDSPYVAVSGHGTSGPVRRTQAHTWEFTIVLDRTYRTGDEVEVGLAIKIPTRSMLPPMSIFMPKRACRSFRTTVNLGDMAEEVWVLDGAPPPAVNSDVPFDNALIGVSRDPEVTKEFTQLHTGLAYGLRWRWAPGRP